MPFRTQHLFDNHPKHRLIIDNENIEPGVCRTIDYNPRRISCDSSINRERESDDRSLVHTGNNSDRSGVALHYLLNHWQAQSSSSFTLGSEERFEGPLSRFRTHAGTFVDNIDDHVLRAMIRSGWIFYDRLRVPADYDAASFWHCINGIQHEVRQSFANFGVDTGNLWNAPCNIYRNPYISPGGCAIAPFWPCELDRFSSNLPDINRLKFETFVFSIAV